MLQMVIDSARCMNCKACLLACQQRNNVPAGYSRNWVRSTPVPENAPAALHTLLGVHSQPGNCMQCKDAPCVRACPTGATRMDADGVVRVLADKCVSCGACIAACPYGARYRNPQTHVVDKCDYCASSRAQGLEPACVTVCPTHARLFGDVRDADGEIARALHSASLTHVMDAVHSAQPVVGYVGETLPTDWARSAKIPAPIRAMHPVAQGVKWTGGMVLAGLAAVGLRQLFPGGDGDEAQEQNTYKDDV